MPMGVLRFGILRRHATQLTLMAGRHGDAAEPRSIRVVAPSVDEAVDAAMMNPFL